MRSFLSLIVFYVGAVNALVSEAPMDSKLAQASFVEYAANIATAPVEALPVLSNGRIKPLHTLARDSILFVSGSFSKWGLSATQIYLALPTSKASSDIEIINVRSPELRETLGYKKTKRFFSLRELEHSQLKALSDPLALKEEQNSKSLSQSDKDTLEAYSQMAVTEQVISGNHLAGAVDIAGKTNLPGADSGRLSSLVSEFLTAVAQNPTSGGGAKTTELVKMVKDQPMPPLFAGQLKNMELEVWYTKSRLFLVAAILYLLLGSMLLIPQVASKFTYPWVIAAFSVPALCQIIGFAIRVYITGFAPVTSMYGTMLWVSLGVGLFTLLLYILYRKNTLAGILWIGSALILLLTESIPLVLSAEMDPIVAVLRSNYWLTIHVLTITISYAAFTITMLIGNTALVRSLFIRDDRAFFTEYAQYAYRMIQLGVFLLTVGIILGGVWADYSWGRFWGWDPKETWALIADVGYIIILHARYAGWLKSYGLLAACPVAYLLVVMAWYGVNFILAAGLHSYGFSSGGALAVAIFVAVQMTLFLVAGALRLRQHTV